jgi:hypothetical protein
MYVTVINHLLQGNQKLRGKVGTEHAAELRLAIKPMWDGNTSAIKSYMIKKSEKEVNDIIH